MDEAKQKLLTRIHESTNVLVTVSNNPSLDQLAGAIGLTLLLNKLGKHATAVFSGEVPSIIEYLQPEDTIEKNTDSLRDFIIALDKSKADKLRYKVEDKMVKIFITPYRTSLSEKDLEFSQGDFNVDVVVALGVHEQKDLDQAITAHGRILHDATVSSINNQAGSELGTINWVEATASSLCEMLYDLSIELKADAIDSQMATALLTGIVSETKRFGNEKTTAKTLDVSSHLMVLGANQQLVAARLDTLAAEEPEEEPEPEPVPELEPEPDPEPKPEPPKEEPKEPVVTTPDKVFKPAPKVKEEKEEGTLQVDHEDQSQEEEDLEEIQIDEHGVLYRPTNEKPVPPAPPAEPAEDEEKAEETAEQSSDQPGEQTSASSEDQSANNQTSASSRLILDPPTLGGTLTSAGAEKHHTLDPSLDPTAVPGDKPLLSHASKDSDSDESQDETTDLPPPQADDQSQDVDDSQTLTEIEQAVDSPHQQVQDQPANEPPAESAAEPAAEGQAGPGPAPPTPDLTAARDAVMDAVNSGADLMPPIPRIDLNAAPMLDSLNQPGADSIQPAVTPQTDPVPSNQPLMPTSNVPGTEPTGFTPPTPAFPVDNPTPFPSNLVSSDPGLPTDTTATTVNDPLAPPPVPPPMMPQGFVSPSDEPADDNKPNPPQAT